MPLPPFSVPLKSCASRHVETPTIVDLSVSLKSLLSHVETPTIVDLSVSLKSLLSHVESPTIVDRKEQFFAKDVS